MAKLDELWDPVPRRLIADLRTEKWTTERPASNVDAWVWAFRQIDEGAVPSVRDLCAFTGWGNRRAARMLDEVIAGWNEWSGKQAARQEQHHARKRIYSAPTPRLQRTFSAPTPHLSESVVDDIVDEGRTYSASTPHLPRTSSASTPHRRARSLFRKESDTTEQGEESGSPNLVPSPPPAEPSGSSERWTQAAEFIEADPEAWRASEEFQPSSDDYVFDDADQRDIIEQPSDPRQIESPAQPFDPIEGSTPSPPPSASPAARPRGLSGEGDPSPASAPQSAPSIFGRTDTAPEPSAPATAPPRLRKPLNSTKAADALAVYAAWRVYHPRAAEAPTPDAGKVLGRILIEAGGLDGALLLMEWAHLGTCERARQLRGEAPWPDGRRTVYTDLGSLSRHIASRLEMARDWKDKSTDKDTGLKVLHVPETPRASFRGRDTTNAMNILADIARRDLERQHGL